MLYLLSGLRLLVVGTVISVSLAQSQHGSVLSGDGEVPEALPRKKVILGKYHY